MAFPVSSLAQVPRRWSSSCIWLTLESLYLLGHPVFIIFLHLLLLFDHFIVVLMVILVLDVLDILPFLLEFPLPLPILLMQILNVLLDLQGFAVAGRPVVILSLELTDR